jgi:aldehyde dehydrogenase (NAD+)
MYDARQFYINGEWIDPVTPRTIDVINPATESRIGVISNGSEADVDRAVAAARAAFPAWSATSREQRLALLQRLLGLYQSRLEEMAQVISAEMGAPIQLARKAQAPAGMAHILFGIEALTALQTESLNGKTQIVREPIGVCALITPWNWPINQIACKVVPALATGCTVVLKPSEIAPLDAWLFAQMLHEAGCPPGVFNLVNGDGAGVGNALTRHPDVDMVSFTGSTRAGIQIQKNAAETIKRVTLELGGKSANIILPDADLQAAVTSGVLGCFQNTGQSCNAPTRMLVPRHRLDDAIAVARAAAARIVAGDPASETTTMGPSSNALQFGRVQGLIQKGIDEGAPLVTGGTGKPDGCAQGYFVKPTIFAPVSNEMAIAREEIFGPVLCIIPYEDEEDAIRIANDTVYGLAAYVSSSDVGHAVRVAHRLRAGNVYVNGALPDMASPFGGYKQSGNGREWGAWGFEEFLETKAIVGA